MEDSIYAIALEEKLKEENEHSKDLKGINEKFKDLFHLRGYIRYLTLVSERENSSEELQILSPNDLCPSQENGVIKNGLNSEKAFLQVHYLKGYFLLHHLSALVSRYLFDQFLGLIVNKFHGQLISSNDFLDAFYDHFPLTKALLSRDKILKDWLSNPDINSDINDLFNAISSQNILFNAITDHFNFWISLEESYQKKLNFTLSKYELLERSKFVYPDQLVILFEKLLQCEKLGVQTMKEIYSFYKIQSRNGDIKHRWCELIVKHNYPDINHISNFLTENQAMGVYLYGELVISENKKHKRLARKIYENLKDELDPKSKNVIFSMISGL